MDNIICDFFGLIISKRVNLKIIFTFSNILIS
jgi:hypothetical protein